MGELKKMSLLEETEREAQRIKRQIEANPDLEDIVVTEEMDAALFAKIQAFEEENKKNSENKEKEKSADTSKKTIPYRKKTRKNYFIIGLAAVLVLVLGTGLLGVGNKSYWKEKSEREYVGEEQQVIKVEDMEDIISEDGVELNVYDQIEDKLGINVVALRYIPKEMKFSEIEILENMQQARVFYNYYGEIIRYTIYLNSADSSWVEKIEDQKVDEYFLSVMSQRGSNIEIKIEEYQIPEYDEYRRVASFEYKGIQYQLKGIMEKEEFEKILKNLKFF